MCWGGFNGGVALRISSQYGDLRRNVGTKKGSCVFSS